MDICTQLQAGIVRGANHAADAAKGGAHRGAVGGATLEDDETGTTPQATATATATAPPNISLVPPWPVVSQYNS
jgi:hypothetical protein